MFVFCRLIVFDFSWFNVIAHNCCNCCFEWNGNEKFANDECFFFDPAPFNQPWTSHFWLNPHFSHLNYDFFNPSFFERNGLEKFVAFNETSQAHDCTGTSLNTHVCSNFDFDCANWPLASILIAWFVIFRILNFANFKSRAANVPLNNSVFPKF